MRVGIDVSTSNVSTGSGSVTFTVRYYTQNQYSYSDDQSLKRTGNITGTVSFRNSQGGSATLRNTATHTYTYGANSYGSSPGSRTFGATLQGAFNGVTPAHSRSVKIPARPYTTPVTSTSISTRRASETSVPVSWNNPNTSRPQSPVTNWTLQARVFTGNAWSDWGWSKTVTGTSYTWAGGPNRIFQFRVRANNSVGSSGWSAGSGLVYMTPAAPTGVRATTLNSTTARLTWSRSNYSAGVTAQIQRSVNGGAWSTIRTGIAWNDATEDVPTGVGTNAFRVRYFQTNGSLASSWATSNTITPPQIPKAPTTLAPNGSTFDLTTQAIRLTWRHVAGGDGAGQANAQVRFSSNNGATWTITRNVTGSTQAYTLPAGTLTNGITWRWQVRTQSNNGLGYGPWSASASLTGRDSATLATPALAPTNLIPDTANAATVDMATAVTFAWRHNPGADRSTQGDAQIRWSTTGATGPWTTVTTGSPTGSWTFPAGTWPNGTTLTWQVRTLSASMAPAASDDSWSPWSAPAITTGVSGAAPPPEPDPDPNPEPEKPDLPPNPNVTLVPLPGRLGAGDNTAFIYDQRGEQRLLELTDVSALTYNRVLNGISEASVAITVPGDAAAFQASCCGHLGDVHTWHHSLVIFRNDGEGNDRVWEGPIRRIEHTPHTVTINAKDVLGWMEKRARGAERNVTGQSVVSEMNNTLRTAYAAHDPNVLAWLEIVAPPGNYGALVDREIGAWDGMLSDELGQLADSGGRYTTVGRRILLWHDEVTIGRTRTLWPAQHLASVVTVTEDGDTLVTRAVVRDDDGNWQAIMSTPGSPADAFYGQLDQVASIGYSPAAANALVAAATALVKQNFPAHLTLDIPSDSTIACDAPFPLDHLVPGVVVPVESRETCRNVSGTMILGSVSVTQNAGEAEKVAVSLIPATQALIEPVAPLTVTRRLEVPDFDPADPEGFDVEWVEQVTGTSVPVAIDPPAPPPDPEPEPEPDPQPDPEPEPEPAPV